MAFSTALHCMEQLANFISNSVLRYRLYQMRQMNYCLFLIKLHPNSTEQLSQLEIGAIKHHAWQYVISLLPIFTITGGPRQNSLGLCNQVSSCNSFMTIIISFHNQAYILLLITLILCFLFELITDVRERFGNQLVWSN